MTENKEKIEQEIIQEMVSFNDKHEFCGKIRERLGGNESPRIGIFMHDTPDPDCFGSAVGLQKILSVIVPDASFKLVYGGEISHPQNKTMVNVLNLMLTNRSEIPSIEEEFDLIFCVDVMPERCGLKEVGCFMAFDHHKVETNKAENIDIRMVGSTATIIWDYMQELKIGFAKNDEADSAIATGMVLAIKTDTNDLSSDNLTEIDMDAYKDLMTNCSSKLLGNLINYPIPPYHFELRKRLDIEDNTRYKDGVFIGAIGYVPPSKRDVLPTTAEERARVEGVDTAFVFAIVGSNIEVCVRSSSLSVDVNTLCRKVFGKENGGGKAGAGAARIPMNFLSVENSPSEIQNVVWDGVKEFMFHKIQEEMADQR